MRLWKRRHREPRRDGCGFVVLTCVFSCFFLVLNSALISKIYPLLASQGPALLGNARVVQAVMFVGPVALLFIEWWMVDLVVELVTPRRDTSELLHKRDKPLDPS